MSDTEILQRQPLTFTTTEDRSRALAAHIDRALAIERLRDTVIDLDILVDDARADIRFAVARLQDAVRARNEAVCELCNGAEVVA